MLTRQEQVVGVVCGTERRDVAIRAAQSADVRIAWFEQLPSRMPRILESGRLHAVLIEWGSDGADLGDFLTRLSSPAPRPLIAICGRPPRADLFRLAAQGVDAYFEELDAVTFCAICSLCSTQPKELLQQAARASVGRFGLKEAQRLVRQEMLQAAIVATDDNRHAAARLLRVDRRYVVRMSKTIARGDSSNATAIFAGLPPQD
jgi:hypothetical protein